MKLYVIDDSNNKIYLNLSASNRSELRSTIGSEKFFLREKQFSVFDVKAENEMNNSLTGAIVGGTVGALGGPVGILIGGLVGGVLGNTTDEKENARVNSFNNSR